MPEVIVIGGPNGAGKSTLAPALLRDTLGILEYVNADTIAEGFRHSHRKMRLLTRAASCSDDCMNLLPTVKIFPSKRRWHRDSMPVGLRNCRLRDIE
jgi:predicted ABC-type ATPase